MRHLQTWFAAPFVACSLGTHRRLPLYSTAEPLAPSPHPAAPPLCPNRRQASSEQLRSTRETPLPPLNRAAAPQLLPSLSSTLKLRDKPPRPFPPPNQIRANPFSTPRFASPQAPTHFPGSILLLCRASAALPRAPGEVSVRAENPQRGQLGTALFVADLLRCKPPPCPLLLTRPLVCLFMHRSPTSA